MNTTATSHKIKKDKDLICNHQKRMPEKHAQQYSIQKIIKISLKKLILAKEKFISVAIKQKLNDHIILLMLILFK